MLREMKVRVSPLNIQALRKEIITTIRRMRMGIKIQIAHIMNIPQNKHFLQVWIGLANVERENIRMLDKTFKAYVQVLGLSYNKEFFVRDVTKALKESGFVLRDIEDIETFQERINKYAVEIHLQKKAFLLIANAQESEVLFGTFHSYED